MRGELDLRPGPGGSAVVLLEPDPGRLGLARLQGPVEVLASSAAAWVVVEGGRGAMEVAGERAELEGGRQDVFEAPGWPALAGPGSVVRLEGPSLGAVVAWRRWDRPLQPRLLAPGQVAEEQRGSGPARRLVRTYLATGPLMAGETINEPGGWSSFPPHRHEHEEVYLYRFSPPHGFGASLVYEGPGGPVDAAMVRDGSVPEDRVRLPPGSGRPREPDALPVGPGRGVADPVGQPGP
ncbi:MAG TPA: 5-deoxy-glucuronate isomerase [Acidimicrobiales bacterium]|nr:5-deoxy-glucuronate isomerase [Acidimicrobiales bacterium]